MYEFMLRSVSVIPRVETKLYSDWVRRQLYIQPCLIARFPLIFIPYFAFLQPSSQFGSTLKPIILPEVLHAHQEEVRRVFWAECVRPKEYIHKYDKYATLVSRQAEKDVEQILRDQHSFQEFMVQVLYYQKLIDEIRYMPSKVNALKKNP